ncbi:MAG: HEPN domain-containing protein [Candidatus Caldarchaeum sp.]|jgi:HEPN domain-containing protein
MREEARDWYDGALRMAERALEAGLNNWALFAAHQAVEKALKALIIAKKRERPPKTHDLVELL